MSFRAAKPADVDFFWHWREQAEAQPWYESKRTTREEHNAWYADRLRRITMLVWERMDHGGPAGVVRIDSNGEVAFGARPDMLPWMLTELLTFSNFYGGRLKVTVDKADRATAKALRAAGFIEYPVKFFAYKP